MTLVYRAIWRDDRPTLGDSVHEIFEDWVKDRSGGAINAVSPGQCDAQIRGRDGPATITVDSDIVWAEDGSIEALRNDYTIDSTQSRWRTKVRSWTDETGAGWCWVDTQVMGDEIAHPRRLDVVSPLVVRQMIQTGVAARVGDFDITTSARRFTGPDAVESLAELVSHFERVIPLVVFARSQAREAEFGQSCSQESIVAATAERLAGIAIVADVDEDVANGLTELMGRDFGVYNGALRVYGRNVDPADEGNAFRHRYITADRYMGRRTLAAQLVGRMVGPESTLRRPPDSYYLASEKIDRAKFGDSGFEEKYRARSLQFDAAQEELITLRKETELLEVWEEENVRLKALLDHAKRLLFTHNVCDDFDAGVGGLPHDNPPRTSKDTVALVNKYLSDRVEIHDKALRDPKQMDRTALGSSWASTAWQGFKALWAYAEWRAEERGNLTNFETWCESEHNYFRWPPGKVASTESGTTQTQRKGTRDFPVSVKVAGNGTIEMLSHLKVQIQGNSDIPRIYFMYSERTKKVHVGFYGPHARVPNTKS